MLHIVEWGKGREVEEAEEVEEDMMNQQKIKNWKTIDSLTKRYEVRKTDENDDKYI